MKAGDWVARVDGRHWCSLIPNCDKHKLVKVAVGPGEEIPPGLRWHFALPESANTKKKNKTA